MTKEKPCAACRELVCPQERCHAWQGWFLERWAAVNAYAWKIQDELGREEPKGFVYELPHMVKSPCCTCPCRAWCDTPCSKRLKWWDRGVARHAQCKMQS